MPKFTKEELQKLIENINDNDTIHLFDKDELNEIVQVRLGKEKPKLNRVLEEKETLEKQLQEMKLEIEEIKNESEKGKKSEVEQLQAKLEKLGLALETVRGEREASLAKVEALHSARKNDFLDQSLRGLLLAEGANPDQMDDIVLVARAHLSDQFSVAENGDSSFKLAGIDPLRQEPVDPRTVVKGFLDARPIYQRGRPGGAGAPTANPSDPQPPQDPYEGLSGIGGLRKAFRDKAKHKAVQIPKIGTD